MYRALDVCYVHTLLGALVVIHCGSDMYFSDSFAALQHWTAVCWLREQAGFKAQ